MTDHTPNKSVSGDENPMLLRERMTQLVNGFQVSAAIGVAARLGVADALAEGPCDAVELAARVSADASSLRRLLRALARSGVFAEPEEGLFALTPLGQLLRSDSPVSMRRAADFWTQEWHWRPYGHLTTAVRTGHAAMEPAHGCGYWEFLAKHPQAAASFHEIMSFGSSLRASALIEHYDFSSARRLVDVGGGQGALAYAALQANPELTAVVFDLPGVIEDARARVAEAGLAGRTEVMAGSFLDEVPTGGDLYVLSWILHDWDDKAALRILKNCRRAMGDGARLLLIEMVLPSAEQPASPQAAAVARLAESLDLEMLTVVGGRERTAAEFEALLAAAGFQLVQMRELATLFSLMEARPN